MKLFTFAHRKEAVAFLIEDQFKPVPFHFDGFYKNEKNFLLITGEGPQTTSERIISVLGQWVSEIDEIINIGVAGSLNQKIIKDSIINVRTVYAQHAERLEFKSFTTKENRQSKYDCITAFERITDLNYRKSLSHFADVVDRELWAIGSAAHLYKVPFQSIKYISDDLKSSEFCQIVASEAPLISKKLYNFYTQNFATNTVNLFFEKNEMPFEKNPLFYFTVTQKRQLSHSVDILKSKGIPIQEILESEFIISLENNEFTPKERSKKLLEHLMGIINPFHLKLTSEMEKIISPYKSSMLDIQYDKSFENPSITFNFNAKTKNELEFNLDKIKTFPIDKIQEIFSGNIDV